MEHIGIHLYTLYILSTALNKSDIGHTQIHTILYYPPPLTKITPQKQQPPVLKLFKPPSPQTVYSTLRLEAKKHEGVKLMDKLLVKHNCQQIKNKMKSEKIQ